MGIAPGSLVDGRYRVEARVGAGGFGVVYAAFHLALERRVALKVLRQEGAGGADAIARTDAIARFVTEGRTLTRLRHPNIVSALDFGTATDGEGDGAGVPEPYLVLEWCEGETLASYLRQRGPLDLDAACALFEPIVDAMAHAHASHVVHRDLKPANVMVVPMDDGGVSPRIVDFGIAQIAEGETAPSGDTRTDRRGGPHTPGYAAPEQIASGRTGPWTDVHALGLLFVELVTGQPPFATSGSADDDDLAIIDATRPTPAQKGVAVGALEPVMVKSLSLRPAARYADAGELLAAFRGARGLPQKPLALASPKHVAVSEPSVVPVAPSLAGGPGLTVTDEGVGGNVIGTTAATRRPVRRVAKVVGLFLTLGLVALGVRGVVAARAGRVPTDPSDGKELCALTNDDVRRRLARAGAPATYVADYGATAKHDTADRSVYFGFAPHALLSGVHIASYPITSGESWISNARYGRRQSPQITAPAVFATHGSCTLVFTGHPTATPDAVRRSFDSFRLGLPLDVVDEWPGKPATTLAALPAWELEDRALAAGLAVELAVLDDREGQIRFREPAAAVLRMTSDARTMGEPVRQTSSAYVAFGSKIIWVERLPPAEGEALLRRVLGPLVGEITRNERVRPAPPPEDAPPEPAAWVTAPINSTRKLGGLSCEVRTVTVFRRAVCRPVRPGVEITMQVQRGSFDTVIDEPDEVGMVFRVDNGVRLAFSAGKDKLVYDTEMGGVFGPAGAH